LIIRPWELPGWRKASSFMSLQISKVLWVLVNSVLLEELIEKFPGGDRQGTQKNHRKQNISLVHLLDIFAFCFSAYYLIRPIIQKSTMFLFLL
jgi:hypothetical protein